MITFRDHPSPPECLDDRLAPLLSLLRGRQAGPLRTARTTSATVPSWWRHASRKNRLQFELLIQTLFLSLFCLFWGCEPLNVASFVHAVQPGKEAFKDSKKKKISTSSQISVSGRWQIIVSNCTDFYLFSHVCLNSDQPDFLLSCTGVLTLHPHILYI